MGTHQDLFRVRTLELGSTCSLSKMHVPLSRRVCPGKTLYVESGIIGQLHIQRQGPASIHSRPLSSDLVGEFVVERLLN